MTYDQTIRALGEILVKDLEGEYDFSIMAQEKINDIIEQYFMENTDGIIEDIINVVRDIIWNKV